MDGTILLVDDEVTIRDSLSAILRKEGYVVDCAGHAREALDSISRTSYDLVITDIRMPGMNGLELAEQITTLQPKLKILVITGFGSLDTAIQAQHRGVSDYLIKPINIKDLLSSIRSALNEQSDGAQTAPRPLDAKLKDRMEYFSLLSDFTANLNASLDVGEIMETTLDRLKKTVETTRASIVLASPVIGEIYSIKNVQRRPALVAGSGLCASLGDAAPEMTETLLLSPRDGAARRNPLHAPFYDAMDRAGIQQAFLVPLVVKNRVLGMVDVCTLHQPSFAEIDLILSQIIVNQAALALARAFTYLEREERTKEIGLLYSLNVKLNQSLKISDSIKAICEGAVEITGADGSVLQTSLETGAIKNFIFHRELGFHKEMRRGSQDWLIPPHARNQAFYSNDPVMDERVNSLALYSLNIKSLAYVPLIFEWEGLGGLVVFYREEGETFGQRDLDLLHLYGRHASEVLLNSQLFEAIRSSRERLVIDNNKMDIVLANVADGIVTIGLDGRIQYLNDAMSEMFGIKKEEVIGKPCAQVFSLDLCRDGCPVTSADPHRESQKCFDTTIRTRAGETMAAYMTFGPIRDSSGKVSGWVKVIRNSESIKRVDRLKDTISNALERGLRAPLEEAVDRLKRMELDPDLSPASRETLQSIHRSAGDMQSLLTCLLALCNGRSASRTATREEFDMRDMARTVLREVEEAAKEKGVSLQPIGAGGALAVEADTELIRGILKTLLTGAIRASSDGGTVSICADRTGPTSDTEAKYEIFLDTCASTTEQQGTGCGVVNEERSSFSGAGQQTAFFLEPLRDIVSSRGGCIWAERYQGGKTKFTFTLPGKIVSEISPKTHAA